jgi:hypothetical protein
MSAFLNKLFYMLDYSWAVWCGLLKNQAAWWDPYGATAGAILLFLFLGLAFKLVRE